MCHRITYFQYICQYNSCFFVFFLCISQNIAVLSKQEEIWKKKTKSRFYKGVHRLNKTSSEKKSKRRDDNKIQHISTQIYHIHINALSWRFIYLRTYFRYIFYYWIAVSTPLLSNQIHASKHSINSIILFFSIFFSLLLGPFLFICRFIYFFFFVLNIDDKCCGNVLKCHKMSTLKCFKYSSL